jgi:transcriptional regulator with XRE-family HTH domain
MSKRVGRRGSREKTFLREWRRFRGLSLQQAAERLDMSAGHLSRIENGISGYTQDFLVAAAELYGTDIISLLIRHPARPNDLWSAWSAALKAAPQTQQQIAEIVRTLLKTGS